MNSQFTIRLDNVTNKKTIERAESLNITRATLVRNALTSYLDKPNSNQDSKIISMLKEQLSKSQEQLENKDKQIDQLHQLLAIQSKTNATLSDEIMNSIKLIEDLSRPKNIWQKLRMVLGA